MKRRLVRRSAMTVLAMLGLLPAGADADEGNRRCRVLCAPELKIEPTWTVENLLGAPRVERSAQEGRPAEVDRLPRTTVFEAIFAVGVPTEIPWLGLTLEAAFAPFEDDNDVELEAEVNFTLLGPERTGGWIDVHFDVVDQFSPAERPGEGDAYTHKLDFELDAAVAPFLELPKDRHLRNLELELSLDYLATGLPRAGDVIDGRRYLDDPSGWSLSVVLVFPIAPWSP